MRDNLQPDPSVIGGVPRAPFVFLPDPITLFQTRARRFAFLAETSELGGYLKFLGEISALQARLAVMLPEVTPFSPAKQKTAALVEMPPIDRATLVKDVTLSQTLDALFEGASELAMPEPAKLALSALRAADKDDRQWLLSNILSDQVPEDSVAPHIFVAAAVELHMARLASTLDETALVRIRTGVCPVCGGKPATSTVMGTQGIENVRYAACSACATQWNEVRVKCLCCDSTKGISYRSVDTHEATVKAEVCKECNSWLKIFYRVKNPTLDAIADDVGSLGLDILMKDTEFRRFGFNPYLTGY